MRKKSIEADSGNMTKKMWGQKELNKNEMHKDKKKE